MTLLTILGIWVFVSVPASLVIASLMMVGDDRELKPVLVPERGHRKIA